MPEETMQQATAGLKSNGKWIKKEATMKAGEAREDIINTAQKAYDGIIQGATDFVGQFKTDRYFGFVRQYPVQTAVGALALGVLLGAVLVPRKGE